MTWIQALAAGALQGATEFLPVSSSGHLVILHTLFGYSEAGGNLAFAAFLHLATLVSVGIVFRRDIGMLAREAFTVLCDLARGKRITMTPERRFLGMVVIATVPAVVAGVGIKLLAAEPILENIFVVATMLLVTATLMFVIDRLPDGTYTEVDAPLRTTLLVGVLQAIAILPGISRSGATIFGGVFGGLTREFAVRFAFILSIPVILGAALIETLGVVRNDTIIIEPLSWAIGFVAAALVGIAAIKILKLLARNRRFYIFGIYCLFAAAFAFLVGLGVIG